MVKSCGVGRQKNLRNRLFEYNKEICIYTLSEKSVNVKQFDAPFWSSRREFIIEPNRKMVYFIPF